MSSPSLSRTGVTETAASMNRPSRRRTVSWKSPSSSVVSRICCRARSACSSVQNGYGGGPPTNPAASKPPQAQNAQLRHAVLIDDVTQDPRYIEAVPNVRSELAIPLITKNRVIGVIDIEAREPGYFNEEHVRVLTLVASRMAAGIENAQLYTRTTKQARILLLLNEIARELTSILNLDELLGRIAELVRRLIDYQMFSILLLDATGEKLEHRFSLRFNENIHLKNEIPLGRGLVGSAAESQQAVLVPDVTKDPRYVQANPETRSELAVPLVYKGKVIGVLDLEHTRRGFFTEEHQRTMTTLAAQIAIAIENARLYEEIERQERRLERDLA